MSQIRRQSIISSLMVYLGFALGFINTYLFTKEGGFTKEQYGLTGIFIALANLMFSFANLGMPSYIFKFYPYYQDNLDKRRNDILTWALLVSLIGFCFVVIGGIYFKDLIIFKFGKNSPEFINYYYWIFPVQEVYQEVQGGRDPHAVIPSIPSTRPGPQGFIQEASHCRVRVRV